MNYMNMFNELLESCNGDLAEVKRALDMFNDYLNDIKEQEEDDEELELEKAVYTIMNEKSNLLSLLEQQTVVQWRIGFMPTEFNPSINNWVLVFSGNVLTYLTSEDGLEHWRKSYTKVTDEEFLEKVKENYSKEN